MELRTNHHVGAARIHDREEILELLGVQIHIGIEECYVRAFRIRRTANERVAFAFVAPAPHDPHAFGPSAQRVDRGGVRSVHASVIDDDDLEIDPEPAHCFDGFTHVLGN